MSRPQKEFWYDTPHQVRILHNKGIVFHEYFIDAATGAAWRIKEILEISRILGINEDDILIEYDDWLDFSRKL